MSTTTKIALSDGTELRVTTEPSLQGTRAWGIAFDENADVITETQSQQYIGYCHGCIVQSVVTEMEPYTDRKDITVHYECTCD